MNLNTDALEPYALVVVAGLFVHACFQLSLGILTVIASHSIGSSKRHSTVLGLSVSYIIGAFISTAGLLALATYFFHAVFPVESSPSAMVILCTLVMSVGLIVLLFYYRRSRGTQLWLPRPLTEMLTAQAKQTRTAVDAFRLGLVVVLIELPFLVAPLAIAGAVLSTLPPTERGIGIVAYSAAANLPLVIVTVMIGGGHKISTIQRWRESNKHFLQWTSGLTLILLGIYLFAVNIWGQTI